MQWTPNGLVPANGMIPKAGEIKGGFVDENGPVALPVQQPVLSRQEPAKPKKTKTLTPKNVVALAKARLKEVKTELRRMKTLEKEKGELERLIAAAENKPKSNVREIKRVVG